MKTTREKVQGVLAKGKTFASRIGEKTGLKFAATMVPESLVVLFFVWLTLQIVVWVRSFDDTAGTLDLSTLQLVSSGLLIVTVAVLVAWTILHYSFRPLDRWYDGDDTKDPSINRIDKRSFEEDLKAVKPVHRLFFFAAVYLGLLFATLYGISIFLS